MPDATNQQVYDYAVTLRNLGLDAAANRVREDLGRGDFVARQIIWSAINAPLQGVPAIQPGTVAEIVAIQVETALDRRLAAIEAALSGGSDDRFVFTQAIPSSSWHIVHNLGKHPSVTVVDSAEDVVVGDVEYDSADALTVTFAAPFGGVAYLN